MKKFNPEKELNKIRNGNKNKIIVGLCTLLLIVIVGYSFALYQVRHTQELVFNTVGEFKKRDIYLSVLVDGEYKNDFPAKSEDMLYGGYECDGSATINFDTDKWQVALYASHPDKCTIKFGHKYVDQSGANYPELYQGMIPVYFENGKIYVADVTSEWYNYDDYKWANAVLIDYQNKKNKFYDDNGNLLGGHEVSEEDILQMYVWIPRYKYQLWNVNNESKPKQLINIKFEEGTANTGDITCTYKNLDNGIIEEKCVKKGTENLAQNNDWYTHPAFTFKGTTEENGTELKGIWVGKFDPSDPTDGTGNSQDIINEVTIVPNKMAITYKQLNVKFDSTRNMENNIKYGIDINKIDTHMMKNIEWGAIVYLTQSVYGKYLDKNTCINNNCEIAYNHALTGCTIKSSSNLGEVLVQCEENTEWNKEGIKSSSTNNMYGVYDINSVMSKAVMSFIVDDSGILDLSRYGFEELPSNKYYDLYTYSDIGEGLSNDRGHLGDSTRETLKELEALYGAWDGGYSNFSFAGHSTLHRSGYYIGVFGFRRYGPWVEQRITFRVVLTAQDGNE